ncbi:MAG: RND transporter [Thermodesulfobacteriota bacterium]|nr:RND transporter [Thermodesulfobacteriota bacterium]
MKWLDSIPLTALVIAAVILGGAPFVPEPHIIEKVRMLANGTLTKPIDIFDLAYHSLPILLLMLKLGRLAQRSVKK